MPMAKIAGLSSISRGHGGGRRKVGGSTAQKATQLRQVKARAHKAKKAKKAKKHKKGKKGKAKARLPGY